MTNFESVAIFMRAMEQTVKSVPTVPTLQEVRLRNNLITEEALEFSSASGLLHNLMLAQSDYDKLLSEQDLNEKAAADLLKDPKNELGQRISTLYTDLVNYALVPVVRQIPYDVYLSQFTETNNLIKKELLIELGDALADLLVVVYGAGHTYGLDLNAAFAEVHRSNMSKLGEDGKPIKRPSDGKVLKGSRYSPPDLKKVFFS